MAIVRFLRHSGVNMGCHVVVYTCTYSQDTFSALLDKYDYIVNINLNSSH